MKNMTILCLIRITILIMILNEFTCNFTQNRQHDVN